MTDVEAGTETVINEVADERTPLKPDTGAEALPVGKGTFLGSLYNIINTSIGAGVLAIPYAFQHCGIGLGLVLLAICAFLSAFSYEAIYFLADHTRTFSFNDIGRKSLSPKWGVYSEVVMFLQTFISAAAFPIIILDYADSVLRFFWDVSYPREVLFLVLFVVLLLPLSLLPSLDALKNASLLGNLGVLGGVAVVVKFFVERKSTPSVRWVVLDSQAWMAVPYFVFAFLAHFNAPPMYAELKNRTRGNMRRVTVSGILIMYCFYAVTGICGYMTLGAGVDSDVLKSYPGKSIWVILARIGLAICVLNSFPLVSFGSKKALLSLLGVKKPLKGVTYFAFNSLFCVAICVIPFFVDNLGVVLGITGSLLGTQIVYLIPVLPIILRRSTVKASTSMFILSILTLLLGVVFFITGSIDAVLDAIHEWNRESG